MYEDIKQEIVTLIEMSRDDTYTPLDLLSKRLEITEDILFHLISRERALISNEIRSLSNHDREIAKLMDAMKSLMQVPLKNENNRET